MAGLSICLRVRNSNEMLDRNERFLPQDGRSETGMIYVGTVIAIAILLSATSTYDYHTDLRNIAYQLSRIADALNREEGGAE